MEWNSFQSLSYRHCNYVKGRQALFRCYGKKGFGVIGSLINTIVK